MKNMIPYNRLFFALIFAVLFSSCAMIQSIFKAKNTLFQENFDNPIAFKKVWEDNSWKSPESYSLENGNLKITTRANSEDRVKVRTKSKKFGPGIYRWKIFIPEFRLYERCSIGAFLYHNEKEIFEFDFEIGSGTKLDRGRIQLKDTEAIVYCVSQFAPSNSSHFAVNMGEYANFTMELIDEDGFYLVKWYINNQLVKTLQTNVKSNINFRVHNSLENLRFMGDKKTTRENYVLFDSFEYQKQ